MKQDIPVADDMTRIWHESIAVKISALVLYAVVLVACVTAAVWLWNTDERLEREFAVKADRLAYLAAVGADRGERSAAELLALVTTRLPEYGFSSATVTRGAETARSGDAGSDTTAVVRSIPTGGGPPAILTLYHAPLREAVRSRRNTVFFVTGASALVFGFFLTGIILLFITRPINAIVSATRAATAGDLSVRLDPSSRDEFGVLSRFFNRMLERISEELEERKRAEEQLRRSHEFLRTVLDSLNDEVAIIDVSDFTIVDANVSFFTAYGYTRENIIKKTCHEITHHRDDVCSPPHDSCPLLETLRTGGYAAAE
ncbi:MAG TPA: HAMP domain-containing protein, partial [Nitrospirota bacterium]